MLGGELGPERAPCLRALEPPHARCAPPAVLAATRLPTQAVPMLASVISLLYFFMLLFAIAATGAPACCAVCATWQHPLTLLPPHQQACWTEGSSAD